MLRSCWCDLWQYLENIPRIFIFKRAWQSWPYPRLGTLSPRYSPGEIFILVITPAPCFTTLGELTKKSFPDVVNSCMVKLWFQICSIICVWNLASHHWYRATIYFQTQRMTQNDFSIYKNWIPWKLTCGSHVRHRETLQFLLPLWLRNTWR